MIEATISLPAEELARLLSAMTPDVALELELWSEAFSRVSQMVVVIIHLSVR